MVSYVVTLQQKHDTRFVLFEISYVRIGHPWADLGGAAEGMSLYPFVLFPFLFTKNPLWKSAVTLILQAKRSTNAALLGVDHESSPTKRPWANKHATVFFVVTS